MKLVASYLITMPSLDLLTEIELNETPEGYSILISQGDDYDYDVVYVDPDKLGNLINVLQTVENILRSTRSREAEAIDG